LVSRADRAGAARRWARIPLHASRLVVTVAILVLVAEAMLALAQRVTGGSIFATLASDYPADAGGYVKIAVVGGSAAQGYNAERNFTDVLRHELSLRYPGRRFYVRNYARAGYPFHRYEAEVLKAVIDRYDVFLIYEGNNEAWNYLDDTGYFRTPRYKHRRTLQVPGQAEHDLKPALRRFLESHSRLVLVSERLLQRYGAPWLDELVAWVDGGERARFYRYRRFHEFEPAGVVPDEELVRIRENFQRDLEEIAKLAERREKLVIVASVPTNENYKPFFSVRRVGLAADRRARFETLHREGAAAYARGDFGAAVAFLQQATAIESGVAITDYLLGMAYLRLLRAAEGRGHLQRSIDEDGFPIRSLSSFRVIAQATARTWNSVRYVDIVGTFHRLLDTGLQYDDLFADLHHPSFMGHVVIAHDFLCAMARARRLDIDPLTAPCGALDAERVRSLTSRYRRLLGISARDESAAARLNARWHLSMAGITAYPEEYLRIAEAETVRYHAASRKTAEERMETLLFLALVEARRKNPTVAVALANAAVALAPRSIGRFLQRQLATGELLLEVLNHGGVQFSKREVRFTLIQPRPE